MAALSGVRAFASTSFTREALDDMAAEMAAAQEHRGAHDAHVWLGPDVGLAHSRLAHSPPVHSRPGGPGSRACSQPAHSVDGRWVVALDGVLHNHGSLRSRLDYPFRTDDAAEVVVAGLALDGISFVERLRGHFAFVAHDLRTDTTHLVRDRLGVHPLHYRHVPGGVAFASEVKALLAAGPPPQVDRRSLDAYLACRAVPAPDTLFEGVKKVRPAHRVSLMPGGHLEEVAYWTPPETDPDGTWSPGDAIEAVTDGVREAVRSALEHDAPVGVHLTGSLGCSLVAAQAQQLRGDDVHTFSFALGGGDDDDLAWSRRLSGLLGTSHHEVRLPAGDLEDLWTRLTWHRDAPLSEPTDVVAHVVARAAAEHVPAIVSGHGADELFGGRQHYRLAGLAERSSVLPGRLRSGLDRRVERRLGATFTAAERRRLLGETPPPERRATSAAGADPVDRVLRDHLRHALPDDALERLDRMSMAASLDVRLPLLDDRLVELAFRLPSSVKVRSGRTTWVLREAARPLLPDEVIDRRSSGASLAPDQWWPAGVRDTARRRLTGPDSWVAQTFDQAFVRDLLLRQEHGGHEADRLWVLLSLELWHECCLGGAPQVPRPRGARRPAVPGLSPRSS